MGEKGPRQSNEEQPQQKLTTRNEGGVETQYQSNLRTDNQGCLMQDYKEFEHKNGSGMYSVVSETGTIRWDSECDTSS